jgi:hypothetical protein
VNKPGIRQSTVMGRSAVAVVIAFWQLPVVGYLFGVAGSTTISEVGGSPLAALWSSCFAISGVLMVAVYCRHDETEQAILEIAAILVFTSAMLVYLTVFLKATVTLDGRLAVLALLGSLIVNMFGRTLLLARQVRFVIRSRP